MTDAAGSVPKVVTRKPRGKPDAWPWLNTPAGRTDAFCSYRRHRSTDWRRRATDAEPAGPWRCGVCHPPAVDDPERIERKVDTAQHNVA